MGAVKHPIARLLLTEWQKCYKARSEGSTQTESTFVDLVFAQLATIKLGVGVAMQQICRLPRLSQRAML